MRLSKTERNILRDACDPQGITLSPRALAFANKLKARGLARFRIMRDGWVALRATPIGREAVQ